MNRRLIIFAKAPRMGTVKTRLAQDIGQTAALGFYRQSLHGTIQKARSLPAAAVHIHTSPDKAARGRYFPPGIPVAVQGSGDLGLRMARALDCYPDENRVLIGGDIPDIHTQDLAAAFAQLQNRKAVFGPAEDGGFWLVGLQAGFRPRHLFRAVGWSRPDSLQSSLATLPPGTPIAFVRTLNDIDSIDDYRRHRAV